jgi:DNA-binding NtrC family response regulator
MEPERLPAALSAPAFGRILVVDDERDFVDSLGEVLAATGFDADTSTDPREALERIAGGGYALLIADLVMPEIDGMELLRRCRSVSPDTEVIIATGYGTIEVAVEAMRLGAADFLAKPFDSARIGAVIGRVMETRRLRLENRRLRRQLAAHARAARPAGQARHRSGDAWAGGVSEPGLQPARTLVQVERDAIHDALSRCSGNLSRAARELGVSRTSLYDRIARYDLPRPTEYRARRNCAGPS